MPTTHALHYRQKARELYAEAASAPSEELRHQFTTLARQYEYLAATVENMNYPDDPIPLRR
jgi:hypothetical protein